MYFPYFVINAHSKTVWPFIETNSNFPIQGCFVPSLLEIVILEKKMKMWKVYNDDHDDGQRINCDQKSSLELFGSGELKILLNRSQTLNSRQKRDLDMLQLPVFFKTLTQFKKSILCQIYVLLFHMFHHPQYQEYMIKFNSGSILCCYK